MGHKTNLLRKQSKVWGTTTCIFTSPYTELHLISIKAGGYCSRHSHQEKWNSFYCLAGKIDVVIYRTYDGEEIEERTTLSARECTDVPPNLDHKFECKEDAEVLEIYWVNQIDHSDINRKSDGGHQPVKEN